MRVFQTVRALVAVALATMLSASGAQPAAEYALKAAYVYNFVMYTEWPPELLAEAAPIAVCARADHALRAALAGLEGKTVKGRRLLLRGWSAASHARDCQVVVLDAADRDRWKQWWGDAGLPGVLGIAEDGFGAGAAILLGLENERLVFSVQGAAVRQAGLVLSARLLRLARSVQ